MSGKGSRQRPSQVSMLIADLRYDLAFGNEEQKKIAREKLIELGDITAPLHSKENTKHD